MEIIFILLIISVIMAGGFLTAFFWAVKNGQYDDTTTPAMRMLFDALPPDENKDMNLNYIHKSAAMPQENKQGEKNGN